MTSGCCLAQEPVVIKIGDASEKEEVAPVDEFPGICMDFDMGLGFDSFKLNGKGFLDINVSSSFCRDFQSLVPLVGLGVGYKHSLAKKEIKSHMAYGVFEF